MKKWALLATVFIVLGMFSGCPTDSGNPAETVPPGVVTSITVEPSDVNVDLGGNKTFKAIVAGTGNYPTTVTWSIVETDRKPGTGINSNGFLTVAGDETPDRTLTIKATTTLAGSSVFGTATVTVIDPDAEVTVTGITVSPKKSNVAQGHSKNFTAKVSGTGKYPETVTWSVETETAKKPGTGIDGDGELTVDDDETIGLILTIKATTTLGGSSVSGTATVKVVDPDEPISITDIEVSPSTAEVHQGASQTFTAEVDGTGEYPETVTWSIVETNKKAGTGIDPTDGVLIVAGDETAGRTLTIKATTTLEGSSVSGTATVTVTGSYTPPSTVWLVGDITDWLDGPKTPIELDKETDGTFTWTGDLFKDNYLKFNGNSTSPTDYNTGTWYRPSANVEVDCETLNTSDSSNYSIFTSSEAGSWKITNSGTYTITVDPANSSVTFMRTADLVVTASKVWLVGNVLTNWVTGNPIEMNANSDGTFTWSGELTASSYIKFTGDDTKPTSFNSGTWFRPPTANVPVKCLIVDEPEESSFDRFTNSGDPSWSIFYAGTYTIMVDPAEKKVTFTRTSGGDIVIDPNLTIYLVGAAVTPSWKVPPDATEENKMTQTETDGVYTWTGTLGINATQAVSFATNKSGTVTWGSNGGIWFTSKDSVKIVQNIATDQEFDLVETVGQDNMWGTAAAGTYTITLDTVNMTVTFVKTDWEEPPPPPPPADWPASMSTANKSSTVCIVGSINSDVNWTTPPGSVLSTAYLYDQGDNIFAYTGTTTVTNGQFRIYSGTTSFGPSAYTNAILSGKTFGAQNPNTTDSANTGIFTITSGSSQGFGIQAIVTFIVYVNLTSNQVKFEIQP